MKTLQWPADVLFTAVLMAVAAWAFDSGAQEQVALSGGWKLQSAA